MPQGVKRVSRSRRLKRNPIPPKEHHWIPLSYALGYRPPINVPSGRRVRGVEFSTPEGNE